MIIDVVSGTALALSIQGSKYLPAGSGIYALEQAFIADSASSEPIMFKRFRLAATHLYFALATAFATIASNGPSCCSHF